MASRLILASVLVIVLVSVPVAEAADPVDVAFSNGHFYSQAASSLPGGQGKGFCITDEDGIPFWSEFRRLGGPSVLGYPVSRRFVLDGYVSQATQRALLQWHPGGQRVQLANLMDYLSQRGADGWLSQTKGVPPLPPKPSESGQAGGQAAEASLAWLETWPAIKGYYESRSQALELYGLPSSPIVDAGRFLVMRFQRGALTHWKVDAPWAKAGEILPGNVGDWAKEYGVFPAASLEPEEVSPPSAVWTGKAVWYGEPFHGRRTASGEVFNMHDPTTTAASVFPLGTWLKVTRQDTGASIVVRVNDTGGFQLPIILDLSYGAFARLADPKVSQIAVSVVPLSGPDG